MTSMTCMFCSRRIVAAENTVHVEIQNPSLAGIHARPRLVGGGATGVVERLDQTRLSDIAAVYARSHCLKHGLRTRLESTRKVTFP